MQCSIGCPSPRSAAYDSVATSSAMRTPPDSGRSATSEVYGGGPWTRPGRRRRPWGKCLMTRRRLFSRVGSNREDIEMTAQTGTARAGSYVDAGGLHTYYEVHGAGDPLMLLHGGLCTAETLDGQVPAFAERYRVYVPERRGHGRTPDVEGPITYQNMAADTAAFM